MRFAVLARLGCAVGESPVWDDRRALLFFCDIPAGMIRSVTLGGEIRGTWRLDGPVGSLGLCESGRLVVAHGRDIVLLDPETGAVEAFATAPEPATNRLNDGKVGPDGCFYVGAMDDRPEKEPIAALYRVAADRSVSRVAQGFRVSNGLAWSPDGTRLYHSDSRGPRIDVYPFDPATGALGAPKIFATLDDATGRPDGGACDAEAHYWSAGVSAGALNRFAPDGTLVARYPIPARAPTMPCFAGPDLKTLVVTSLTPGGEADGSMPDGDLFIAEAPVAGAPVARMKGV